MKPKALRNLWLALAVCLLASAAAAAQEAPADAAAARQQPAANAAGVGRLIVEVEYFKGARPAYQPAPGSSWFGRFAMIRPPEVCSPDEFERVVDPRCGNVPQTGLPQPPSTAETVLAVDVKTRAADAGRVEIAVGVHLGVKHFDRFKEVGKYYAAEGETVSARDLTRFGVVPFRFRVLRVGDAAAAPPAVANLTQSVEAAVTDFTPTPLPRGKLVLRNLSPKRVRAVYVRQLVGGRPRSVGFVGKPEGHTLIEPGGTAEKPFTAMTGEALNASDFTPAAVEKIVVATVIFEDYTYEGEVEHAALRRAFAEGERAQLPRLMALVREAHAAPDVETAAALRRFRGRVSALGYEAPKWAVEAVEGNYAGLEFARPGRWKSPVEISMHRVRREMLDALELFETKFKESPAENSFKRWLKQAQARYEGWLARL